MSTSRYKHLEEPVKSFFRGRGFSVAIEPRGARGPDVEGVDGSRVVGEIKHAGEIVRDLRGYWSQWNSNGSFGGKTKEYKLRCEFSADVEQLDSETRGWIAVIYGQLRHYARTAQASDGWLVVEDAARFEVPLNEAIRYLVQSGQINALEAGLSVGIGFYCFRFN